MRYSFKDIVIDSRTGLNPRRNFVLGNGNNNYITIKDIYNGQINITDKTDKVDDAAIQIIKRRSRIKVGDILFVSIGRIGETAIVTSKDDSWDVNESVFVFTVNEEIVTPEYFCLLFQSEDVKKHLASNSSGSTFKSIKMNQLEKMSFELPSLSVQKTITSQLAKAKVVCVLRERELEMLDNLVKARFVEMFGDPVTNSKGWPTKRFDSICKNLDSRRRPITASEREAGEYPYYGASGIVDYVADYIFDEDILLVSEDGANLLMRSTPIAFSVCGKVWVNNHAHVVRFNNMGLQKYIEIFFSMIDISDQITGSAQPKLTQAKLNAMLFHVPDKRLTDSYLEFLSQVDKSKVVVQKALDEARLLFDSLLQKYFG